MERSRDWLAQAERDLEQAKASRDDERHEWACFAAQQAAEKAVMALHARENRMVRSAVIARLLRELALAVEPSLIDKAMVLDNFYLGTRDPSLHSEGPPFEHYGDLQSGPAIVFAREILSFVRSQMG